MTRKDYEMIATTIKSNLSADRNIANEDKRGTAVRALTRLAHSLAGTFAADNPKFNRDRFLAACSVK